MKKELRNDLNDLEPKRKRIAFDRAGAIAGLGIGTMAGILRK